MKGKFILSGLLIFLLFFNGCFESKLYEKVENHEIRIGALEDEVFPELTNSLEVDLMSASTIDDPETNAVYIYINYSLYNGYSKPLVWNYDKESDVWDNLRKYCNVDSSFPEFLDTRQTYYGELYCRFYCDDLNWEMYENFRSFGIKRLFDYSPIPYYIEDTDICAKEHPSDLHCAEFGRSINENIDEEIYSSCERIYNK